MSDFDAALDGLLDPAREQAEGPAMRRPRKAQWQPGVEWRGDDGQITTDSIPEANGSPEWDHVLAQWDLDPAKFQVVEPVLFNTWDSLGPNGVVIRLRQYKARVVRRGKPENVDLTALMAEVRKHKPGKKITGDGEFNVVLADWQIGKADGDGLQGTLKRVYATVHDVAARVAELRKAGRSLGTLNILWPGDSVEGCVGFYEMQTYSVQLDRREQVKVVRRLLLDALKLWAGLFAHVRIVAVGGNHGENRGKGRAFTTPTDNDDLAVIEQVADVLAENPDTYGHVKFIIPPDGLTVTVPVAGYILGLTHGHVARGSGGTEARLRRWYEQQAGGKQPIGDADILVTGHYHHLRMADWGGCYWLQAPALDGGSDWWVAARGEASTAGTLTFCTYPGVKVTDVQVVGG